MGYNKKSPIIKPHLSEKQLNDREYWAIFYNEFDWTNVIWSDETAISIIPNKYSKVWVHKDDGPFIKKTFNNRLKLNVWGCIIKGYGLVVHIYDKTMNGDKYIETLKLKLIPFIKKLHKNGKTNLIFQQDNATVHTSLKVVKFMSDKKIEVMFWPANSPDLNPIENVWHLLKNNIGKVFITNKEELTKLILKTARSLDIQIINNLVDSMDNRINKLFSNNFDSIRY